MTLSQKPRSTSLLHVLEYRLARGVLALLRRLQPELSSNIAGWACRLIGPILPVNRVALINLNIAFPELSRRARRRLMRDIWENLGRTVGEFPHLGALNRDTLSGAGWCIEGEEHLTALARKEGPIIFFSGHIGNWEMLPPIVASYGMVFSPFYRAAANPLIDQLIGDLRNAAIGSVIPMFAKGSKGARQAIRHLALGNNLGVLGDQKMNDGIETRFFGKKAMSPSAAATFALRFNCPIVVGFIERLGPARLKLVVEPVIIPMAGESRQSDIKQLTQTLNDHLEAWIRHRPAQWLWLHRRWPKSHYA